MNSPDPHADRILILDFGAQYTQLIARNLRELGVYCEIYSAAAAFADIEAFNPNGVILSGGPASVDASQTAPTAAPQIFTMGKPLLGICYGMQTMVAQLGGRVEGAAQREYGAAQAITCAASPLLGAADAELTVWMSHADSVTALPPGFCAIAATDHAPYAAIADPQRRFYGVQFHPEVTHTACGQAMLGRFAREICGCGGGWTAPRIIDNILADIRRRVGSDTVLLGLSGGVDSAVAAALLQRAIGAQLACIFIDTGLMRRGEGDSVMAVFAEHLGVRVIRVDAEARFLTALKGIADPERKRKIIGKLFIEIFESEARRAGHGIAAKWLAQGTIYSDVIESAAGHASARVIKSHHNVGGLPQRMALKLLEPLRELFKDEVRKIGRELGLPKKIVNRHPFPGPGLGVRILGEVRKEFADILRHADAIYLEELEKHGLYDEISQAFAVFLPVKSVGVVGDNRAYDYVIALRAVRSVDFMTADWMPIPHDILAAISQRIVNEVRGVSRVVYDISGKPPATIEWE